MNKPKLRLLDFQPVMHQNQQMWYLRDPMSLTDYQLIFPPVLAQMLMFIDGTRTPKAIHDAFCQQVGQAVPFDLIEDTLRQLNEACLLDNEQAQMALQTKKESFRAQPNRPAAFAGLSYPDTPIELTYYLDGFAPDDTLSTDRWNGRAIISPHIDYQRGGDVYAKVWRRTAEALQDADIVLILGTDHADPEPNFTLTRLPYATPYGVLPTAPDLIEAIVANIGEEEAFRAELNHEKEHSVELTAVWLHHICHTRQITPPPVVPILVGSFSAFTYNGTHPSQDETLMTALETIKTETAGQKVLIVASVDFAHMGPAFGHEFNMDNGRRATLQQTDRALINAVLAGDHTTFYDLLAKDNNHNNICGFSPIYLTLKLLEEVNEGKEVGYMHCPADEEDSSLVSIAGLLLS